MTGRLAPNPQLLRGFGNPQAGCGQQDDPCAFRQRNVSTTLIQPGLEFKLWCSALVQWLCGWWHVGLRAEVQAVQGSGDRRAWVPHSVT
jgi:hypothetical protein